MWCTSSFRFSQGPDPPNMLGGECKHGFKNLSVMPHHEFMLENSERIMVVSPLLREIQQTVIHLDGVTVFKLNES